MCIDNSILTTGLLSSWEAFPTPLLLNAEIWVPQQFADKARDVWSCCLRCCFDINWILFLLGTPHTCLVLSCKTRCSLETCVTMCNELITAGGAKVLTERYCKIVKRWNFQENQCPTFNSMTDITENHKGFYCFFLFVDLNSVSSRETGVIRIALLICISEFLILPLKAATSVQAVPPPHPTLFCFTCPSTMKFNCPYTFNSSTIEQVYPPVTLKILSGFKNG